MVAMAAIPDPGRSPLRVLLRRYRRSLVAIYGVTAVENTFDLLYPFAIGLAIDDLLASSYRGLALVVTIWVLHTIVGVIRQTWDTRVFARIYAEAATGLVTGQRGAGADASTVAARSTLVRDLVDSLEYDASRVIGAAFAIVGSLVMLLLYDPLVALVAAALLVPEVWFNTRLARRS